MTAEERLASLKHRTPYLRTIGLSLLGFTFMALCFFIYMSIERTPLPGTSGIYGLGFVLAAIQIPLSFYLWSYIPRRIPQPVTERILVHGYRLIMVVAQLLCAGIALYAGLAGVVTGSPYPAAVLGGIAIGGMSYHLPREHTFQRYVQNLSKE